jgi:sec-independent protein translocase protein TatA
MLGLDNPLHIAFLLVILLLIFGAKRPPEMGRSLGSALRGFKETITGEPESPAELASVSVERVDSETDAAVAARSSRPSERRGGRGHGPG